MKPGFTDKALFFLSLLGLCALAFIAGATALRYQLPPAKFLMEAFDASETWHKTLKEQEDEPLYIAGNAREANENIIAEPIKVTWDKKSAYNGYTLIATGFMDAAWLVDMQGRIVHRWDMPFKKAWPNATHVHTRARAITFIDSAYVFPNGDLIAQYSALGDTPYGYGILKMDKHSKILWTYSENAHHDFYVDKQNGDIYALIHTLVKTPIKGLERLNYPMLVDSIVRLSPEGKELDRLSLTDAFQGSPFELMLYHERNGGLAKWDHFHTNSIEKLEPGIADKFPMFKAGQLLVSIRSMNAVAVIDLTTRKAVWVHDGGWKMQHAAHFTPNGHIILFDNMGHVEDGRSFSRVLEFDPKTLGITWHYRDTKDTQFYSVIVGRVQRLPNGNTLIAESMNARILEVTPEGKIAWSYKLQKAERKDDTLNAILTSVRYKESDLPFLSKEVR
jgi:Arylsulfotransferase (ASST)